MRKMKRIVAVALVMTTLFATTAMAQTPREILSQAYANSLEATTMSMTGNITGNIFLAGVELAQFDIDMHIDMDIDLDTGMMMMYMRMPMRIFITDPLTGEITDESIEIAMFMDGESFLLYESTIGAWFTDPSMDMGDMNDIFALMGDMNEMTAWFMEINEQIMDEITIEFAQDQVDGFYVIEQFMDWDDFMNMIDAFLTPEFFEGMFAFMPEANLAELELAMEELDGLMNEFADLLDQINISLDMVYRSYINQETLEFETYTMVMNLEFAADLDLGILGQFDISGNFVMDFVVNYNTTISWPVIDEVLTLDEVMAQLLDGVEFFTLEFDADALEERVALPLVGMTTAVVELTVVDNANLNVFFANNSSAEVIIMLEGVFFEILQPGQVFVAQLPAGAVDITSIVIASEAALDVEAGFRLTNYHLN